MRFKVLRLLWVLGMLVPVRAGAVPQPVVLHTAPGGVVVRVSNDPGLQAVARGTTGREGECRWSAETGSTNEYLLDRPPFDPVPLSLEWNDASSTWVVQIRGQRVRLSDCKIQFSRTIDIAADPLGYEVYAVGQSSEATIPLTVDGQQYTVLRLPREARGYKIPAAWAPPPLYIVHPGFDPVRLQFSEGELDTAQTVFPIPAIKLKPLYGPFSYWQFNLVLGLALVGGLGLVLSQAKSRRRLAASLRAMQAWLRSPSTSLTRLRRGATGQWSQPQTTRAVPDLAALPKVHGLVGQVLTTELQEQYRIIGILGEGAMAEVFDTVRVGSEDDHAAIKVLRRDMQQPDLVSRFHRELAICAKLQHPAIVRVQDWGFVPIGGAIYPFIVFERIDGETMTVAVHRYKQGVAREAAVIRWSIDILQALHVAHQAGVIHRDVKPDNIMITPDGNARLMDFGLAKAVDWGPLTRTSSSMGTPKYMSPEHFKAASVVPASDIYSLGVTMYEALCGQFPWEDVPEWQIIGKITHETPPSLAERAPGIRPELASLVMRMLAGQVPPRPATAEDVLKELIPLAD